MVSLLEIQAEIIFEFKQMMDLFIVNKEIVFSFGQIQFRKFGYLRDLLIGQNGNSSVIRPLQTPRNDIISGLYKILFAY